MPKNDFDLVFYMCKGGNKKNLKFRILANLVTLFKHLDLI